VEDLRDGLKHQLFSHRPQMFADPARRERVCVTHTRTRVTHFVAPPAHLAQSQRNSKLGRAADRARGRERERV
jgi:hypothetical protein